MGTLVENLTQARNRVDRGWTQHTYVSPGGGFVCAIGAIQREVHTINERHEARNALRRELPLIYRVTDGIESYNDAPWRKKKDVLKIYDRAIRRAQRKENKKKTKPEPVVIKEAKPFVNAYPALPDFMTTTVPTTTMTDAPSTTSEKEPVPV